jgi:hypothetical protein
MQQGDIYRHYKGSLYEVLMPEVTDTESGEQLVIYRSLATQYVWARPLALFTGVVELHQTMVPRFSRVSAQLVSEAEPSTAADQ